MTNWQLLDNYILKLVSSFLTQSPILTEIPHPALYEPEKGSLEEHKGIKNLQKSVVLRQQLWQKKPIIQFLANFQKDSA